MPLLEIVTLELGPPIAKAILKTWLKDANIAQDIGLSLIDALKAKTEDEVAQRRAARQFEEIGERIAESLVPLLEVEGRGLDEASRTAVALAAANTLNSTGITAELLAERNLNPLELANHFFRSQPNVDRHFSSDEISLYRRIILESSQYVIDVARNLPNFTERTFSEVLRRQNQMLSIATQILEEVERIRLESQQPDRDAEAARFEAEYRRAVIRNLDEIELFGVDVSPESRRHRLSVAYITLSVAQVISVGNALPEPGSTSNGIADDAPDEEPGEVIPVDQALRRSRRLIVRGHAGSGKTTLLQWVAVRSALGDFGEQLADWNDTVPFFIRLRHSVDDRVRAPADMPRPETFPALVAGAIAGTMPPTWVHDQLSSGRAILLIDGVDEVPEARRNSVRIWVENLVRTYEDARILITSRPHALKDTSQWIDELGFAEADLQPMEMADIQAFIDHWHLAVREQLRTDPERDNLMELCTKLIRLMRRNRSFQLLATSPLLCAMLCALHRHRHGYIPSDRIELYNACIDLLLERRETERGIDLRDYPNLNNRQKRVILEDVAYWMITNKWSEVSVDRIEERLDLKLNNMEAIPSEATGSSVRALFVERTGMLREPLPSRVDFTHKTFQEFLAAQAALNERDLGVLVQNAHDDQWREVIVLAAGLASVKDRSELMQGLIERGDHEPDHRKQLYLLAVACLETSLELDSKVKTEVMNRLSSVIPPKNMTEAKDLASAGELAVPYLVRGERWRAGWTAASVRALALIGGEAALDALEGYASHERQTVTDELLRCWSMNYLPDEYAR
jgi:hypothetical protein